MIPPPKPDHLWLGRCLDMPSPLALLAEAIAISREGVHLIIPQIYSGISENRKSASQPPCAREDPIRKRI